MTYINVSILFHNFHSVAHAGRLGARLSIMWITLFSYKYEYVEFHVNVLHFM